jgi:hypothetical protein
MVMGRKTEDMEPDDDSDEVSEQEWEDHVAELENDLCDALEDKGRDEH